ncbi:MAG TPA: universal stress protein [Steroidobacteraceae bacterium]|nr:universal stress protein [Steroidobacteraceae bacterium]
MTEYKTILVVVDLSEDSALVVQRAKSIAAQFRAKLTLLHVVEYVPVEPMGEALLPTVQIEEELVSRARARMAELAVSQGLQSAEQLIETGGIKTEIVRTAQRIHADLIVMGSRERHGLGILINLTEDTVLHAAPCDVLAVRLH